MLTTAIESSEKWHDNGLGAERRPLRSSQGEAFIKATTYLEEIFKIYSECYKVLRPGKFMVLVVKDIRRKGLTIPIAADAIKLCQLAGFEDS
ncbi:MAG: hypothetical protein FIB08_14440 [Candidatus Methanoperedens sp.]|nr:hypothetical protein [Candidatus Methanoperedens sp.]